MGLQGPIEHGSEQSKERRLCGSSTELSEQVESLEDQLRKMEDVIFRGEVKVEIVSLVIRGAMKELSRWEKSTLKEEEALRGQLTMFEAQY